MVYIFVQLPILPKVIGGTSGKNLDSSYIWWIFSPGVYLRPSKRASTGTRTSKKMKEASDNQGDLDNFMLNKNRNFGIT